MIAFEGMIGMNDGERRLALRKEVGCEVGRDMMGNLGCLYDTRKNGKEERAWQSWGIVGTGVL
jgi:hypothetical protein